MINIFVQATPLPDVNGRVDYISSEKRQEHLVAVYGMEDKKFWQELSSHCQKSATEAGHEKACEGREWMGLLPNKYSVLYKNREEELAKEISETIKSITGTENITALQWNETMKSFHFHTVCAENLEVNEVSYGAVLQKNTYYDANGKRAYKKDCVDPVTKELLPGCELLRKGERKRTVKRFGTKVYLKDPAVTEMIKERLADKFNRDLEVHLFQKAPDTGLQLSQQPIRKWYSPELKKKIERRNQACKAWNFWSDRFLEESLKGTPEENIAAQKTLKKMRRNMKEYALSEKWVGLIIHYVNLLFDRLKKNAAFEEKQKQQEPDQAQERKPELDLILARAEEKRAAEPQQRSPGRKKSYNEWEK